MSHTSQSPKNPVKYRYRLFLFPLRHYSSCSRSTVLCGTPTETFNPTGAVFSGIGHTLPTHHRHYDLTTTLSLSPPYRTRNPNEMQGSEPNRPTNKSGSKKERKSPPTNSAQPSQDIHPDNIILRQPSNGTSPRNGTGSGSRAGAWCPSLSSRRVGSSGVG